MTVKTLARSLKAKKPAIIRERGMPRYVVLDWATYRAWEETQEDLEDAVRLNAALVDPKNKRRTPLSRVIKRLGLK